MNHLLPHSILDLTPTAVQRTQTAITLFLDIAGFTALTENLMQQDQRGAESLANLLNAAFRPVITAIYAAGGYISGFSGDAFTAIFPVQPHETLRTRGEQACAVAWHIRNLFNQNRLLLPANTDSLNVRIGLASGEITLHLLGNAQYRAAFLTGLALETSVRAEQASQPGQILLDTALAQSLGLPADPSVPFTPLQQPPQITVRRFNTARFPTYPPEAHTPFFPQDVRESTITGEFRPLASLYLMLRDCSLQELNSLVVFIRQSAEARGGYFTRLDFSDKGITALILFGAPTAHENDLPRALQLALLLHQHASQRLRLAITFGQAYFGRVGIPERCELTALGSTVNLAARLAQYAEWGQILVPQSLAQTPGYVFEPLGARVLKGLSVPLPIARLVRAHNLEVVNFSRPLIGRDAELQQITQHTQTALATAQTTALGIYGEAGIGKSHLAFALRQKLSPNVQWLTAAADSILQQDFNPFVDLLRRECRQSPSAAPDENRANFEQYLAALSASAPMDVRAELERTASFMGALLNLRWQNSLYEQLTDARLRYENTINGLLALLRAHAAQQPLVLHLEDAHWLDSASRDLLTRLTRQVLPLPFVLLLTARYTDEGRPPEIPTGAWAVTQVALPPLSPTDLKTFAAEYLQQPLSADLLEFLSARTQSIPFFAQQLLFYLQETHALKLIDGQWELRAAPQEMPATLSAMLIARLDRLTAHVRSAVQAAAVLGREFDVRLLANMLRTEITPILADAERSQIWDALNEIRYLFKHALLRDAAYTMQLRERQRELHQLALESLETLYAESLPAYYEDLAYHAQHGELLDKQREYFRKAGELAQINYRNAAALAHYQRLLPLLQDDPGAQIDIQCKQALILSLTGKWDATRATYEQALSQAQSLNSPKHQAQCLQGLGTLVTLRGAYAEAIEYLNRALSLWRAIGDVAGEYQSLLNLGTAQWHLGKFDIARETFETALALAQANHDDALTATVLNALGNLYWQQAKPDVALELYQRALALQQALGNLQSVAIGLGNIANYAARYEGDIAKAQALHQQSLAIKRQIGDQRGTMVSLGNLANLLVEQGNYVQARDMHHQVLSLAQSLGDARGMAYTSHNLGDVAFMEGDDPAALAYYRSALTQKHRLGERWAMCYDLLAIAAVLGRNAENAESARIAVQLAMGTENLLTELRIRIELAFRQRHAPGIESARAHFTPAEIELIANESNALDVNALVRLAGG